MPLIAYYRVSTKGQGESGLGLDAQRAAVEGHARMTGATILRQYVEIESGKRADRPELLKALADCRRSRATLCIAKLDRLARNVAFTANLMESGVEFVACDVPHANRLTIHIMAAMAEWEREQISTRTKDSLRAFREGKRVPRRLREAYPDGVPPEISEAVAGKLGAELDQCRNLSPEAAERGRSLGTAALRKRADQAYEDIAETIAELRAEGHSLAAIAERLNLLGYTTRRGCAWHKQTVARVLERLG